MLSEDFFFDNQIIFSNFKLKLDGIVKTINCGYKTKCVATDRERVRECNDRMCLPCAATSCLTGNVG